MDLKEHFFEVVQAITPITLIVIILQFTLIGMPVELFIRFLLGTLMVVIGLALFLTGVKVGLIPLGELIGAALPERGSLVLLLVFAFLLGFVATIAEPDVRVLAYQVDTVSGGAIGQNMLIYMVALGVGIFVMIAMLRMLLGIPMGYILAGGYLLIFILSAFVPPHFVPISFDAGGVTTGPMTVPFILALGNGVVSVLGGKNSLSDGFGLVGLASIGPILSVMILGVIYG